MHVKSVVAIVAALLLCASSGCNVAGGGAGGCTSGSCGGLVGMLSGGLGGGGGCPGGLVGNSGNCVSPASLQNDGYGTQGGYTGPLASALGHHHRGPQSHMGGIAGPADGPPTPQVTYPYYTTRGPRDYFLANPASIGP